MTDGSSRGELRKAIDELQTRTVASIDTLIGRLIYIASTRDYNSVQYWHEGLAARYDADIAAQALSYCHQELFQQVLNLPLSELTLHLEQYLQSPGNDRSRIIMSWQTLRAYQTLIPAKCHRLSADLFMSNMKLALVTIHVHLLLALQADSSQPE